MSGALPVWFAPVQIRILPITDKHADYAKKLYDKMFALGLRVEVDNRNEKVGYKIRESQTQKVPYTLVLGDDEMNAGTVNVRPYGTEEQNTESLDEFMDKLSKDVSNYSRED